jgi:hypothetical protein
VAHATLTVVRLAFDQTLENATGVGAPPSTWPAGERIVDATHKAVCSLITGLVADWMITPTLRADRRAEASAKRSYVRPTCADG